VNGSFHDPAGKPLIRPDRFPDMAAMNAYARSRGIGSGWCAGAHKCRNLRVLRLRFLIACDAAG
jgi:hypothetical protein